MRRRLIRILLLALCLVVPFPDAFLPAVRSAPVCTPKGVFTANLSLCQPAANEVNWTTALNGNFLTMDGLFNAVPALLPAKGGLGLNTSAATGFTRFTSGVASVAPLASADFPASLTFTTPTLTSPTLNGTVGTTGLTLPAFTAGGTISGATGITSVGTLTTGVWNATDVAPTYGGTGQNFSTATGIQQWASGVASASNTVPTLTVTATLFANLGAPVNGTLAYCSDCTIANPCAGAGTGAFAKRLNGVWVCN